MASFKINREKHLTPLILLAIFSFSFLSILLTQHLLLPFLYSSEQLVGGFILSMDGYGYHLQALEMAEKIEKDGWQIWRLKPLGQFPVGIRAGFYVLFGPSQYPVIFFQAIVHTLSGFCLFKIAQELIPTRPLHCWVSMLFFIIFPFPLMWLTQFLKDGVPTLGFFLIILGTLRLIEAKPFSARKSLSIFTLINLGVFLVLSTRPYWKPVLTVHLGFLLVCYSALLLRFWKRNPELKINHLAAFFIILLSIALVNLPKPMLIESLSDQGTQPAHPYIRKANQTFKWEETSELGSIDVVAKNVALTRYYSTETEPGDTAIDSDVILNSFVELISYLPKALWISVAAPFPYLWLPPPAERLIFFLEMLTYYLGILGALNYLSKHPVNYKANYLVFFALSNTTLLAVIFPNQATFHRMRYPFFSVLLVLGVLALLHSRKPCNMTRCARKSGTN